MGRDTGSGALSPGFSVEDALAGAVVAGHVTVRVSVDPRKAGLLYGPVHTARRVEDGAATVTFVPCKDKSRTVWPGGLVLASRAPVTVRVAAAGGKSSIRVG